MVMQILNKLKFAMDLHTFYQKGSDLNSFAEAHRLFLLKETWYLEPFMLKGGFIPAYSKAAIEQELSEQSQYVAGCWRAARQGKPWRQADCTGFLRAVTLKWLLSSLHSRVSMALVQCKRSPGSGARRVSGTAWKMNVLLQTGVIEQEIMCQAVLGQAW